MRGDWTRERQELERVYARWRKGASVSRQADGWVVDLVRVSEVQVGWRRLRRSTAQPEGRRRQPGWHEGH